MIDPGKESRTGCAVVIGALIAITSLVLLLVVFAGGVSYAASPYGGSAILSQYSWLFLVSFVAGIVMIMMALGTGLRSGYSRRETEPRRRVEGCVILARYAEDSYGQRLFSESDIDPDICKFYAHVARPDGRRMELKTSWDMFRSLGEGTKGTIEHQGDWLGGFVPDPRRPD